MENNLKNFFKGLAGFPANIFNTNDPNYKHNKETMSQLGKKMKGE